jgi:hypothetical protein
MHARAIILLNENNDDAHVHLLLSGHFAPFQRLLDSVSTGSSATVVVFGDPSGGSTRAAVACQRLVYHPTPLHSTPTSAK